MPGLTRQASCTLNPRHLLAFRVILVVMSTSALAVKIPINNRTLTSYEKAAARAGQEVEDQISHHLNLTQSVAGCAKPLLIDDDTRRRIEGLLKVNLSNQEDLYVALQRVSSLEIGGMKLDLYPKLMDRLQSRALNTPLDAFVQQTLTRLLEEFVGLR